MLTHVRLTYTLGLCWLAKNTEMHTCDESICLLLTRIPARHPKVTTQSPQRAACSELANGEVLCTRDRNRWLCGCNLDWNSGSCVWSGACNVWSGANKWLSGAGCDWSGVNTLCSGAGSFWSDVGWVSSGAGNCSGGGSRFSSGASNVVEWR
jgi:hypothetical protein